tara:strand:- start:73 stop:363 length:291 start_codon:yes stop_codon:yes gene_type:complete
MVAGDIINQTYTTGIQNFQPALGIEIMVTSFQGRSDANYMGLDNGVQVAYTDFREGATLGIGGRNEANIKMGITNTYYLIMNSNATGSGFSGVQIK